MDITDILKNEIAKKRVQKVQQAINTDKDVPSNTIQNNDDQQSKKKKKIVLLSNPNNRKNTISKITGTDDNKKKRKNKIIKMIKDTEQLANDTSYVFTESDFQNLECLCSKSLQYIHYLLNLQEQCYSKTNNTADDKIADSDNDNICKETRINLFPLLIKLRKKTLDRNTLVTLSTTLYYLQLADYKSCLESYMKLSIGNVAWPIGVASIGIHQRSNHSRISNNFNASSNIMIDEETRLWITNIKRLITLLQESEKSV